MPDEKIEKNIARIIESQHESERNLYLKEENASLRAQVEELKKKDVCECGYHAVRIRYCKVCSDAIDITNDQMTESLELKIAELKAQLEAAKEELDDWRESAKRAAGEQCGDEKHCTCVGVLRKDLEAAKLVLTGRTVSCENCNRMAKELETARNRINTMKEVIAFADEELSRLKTGKESQMIDEITALREKCAGYERIIHTCPKCSPLAALEGK